MADASFRLLLLLASLACHLILLLPSLTAVKLDTIRNAVQSTIQSKKPKQESWYQIQVSLKEEDASFGLDCPNFKRNVQDKALFYRECVEGQRNCTITWTRTAATASVSICSKPLTLKPRVSYWKIMRQGVYNWQRVGKSNMYVEETIWSDMEQESRIRGRPKRLSYEVLVKFENEEDATVELDCPNSELKEVKKFGKLVGECVQGEKCIITWRDVKSATTCSATLSICSKPLSAKIPVSYWRVIPRALYSLQKPQGAAFPSYVEEKQWTFSNF